MRKLAYVVVALAVMSVASQQSFEPLVVMFAFLVAPLLYVVAIAFVLVVMASPAVLAVAGWLWWYRRRHGCLPRWAQRLLAWLRGQAKRLPGVMVVVAFARRLLRAWQCAARSMRATD